MEVIATTKDGHLLIQATTTEVKEIINAVTGNKPDKIDMGQKIPAIDYASTITKIKTLKRHSNYTGLLYDLSQLNSCIEQLKTSVEAAATIDL